ncbi:MAG: hypothetical protein AAF636_17150 [Pseudomonadota bacterium]
MLSWGGEFALSLCARLTDAGFAVRHSLICNDQSSAHRAAFFGELVGELGCPYNNSPTLWWPSFTQGSLPELNSDATRQAEKQFETEQWATIAWFLEARGIEFPLAKPSSLMKWSARPSSMFLAKRLGINTPRSRLAFDGAGAVDFVSDVEASGGEVIMKRLADNRFFLDGRASIPVSVDQLDFPNAGNLAAPVWLEERLSRQPEIRAYVIGAHVMAFQAISGIGTTIDSRLDGNRIFVRTSLDQSVVTQLKTLTQVMEMRYCCFDILMKDEEAAIIDINPLGTTDGFPEAAAREVQSLIASEVLSWVEGTLDEERTP